MVAVESYLKRNHAADMREGERRVNLIAHALRSIPSIKTRVEVPPIAFHVPHLHIKLGPVQDQRGPSCEKTPRGDPSMEVWPRSREELVVNPWMTEAGEAEVVARRIRDILNAAGA